MIMPMATPPWTAECSTALRFGKMNCASSTYILARRSRGFFVSIAILAIPVIGSHFSAESLSATSTVRRFGVPAFRPPDVLRVLLHYVALAIHG
jgi:hypothetical protein